MAVRRSARLRSSASLDVRVLEKSNRGACDVIINEDRLY